MILNFEMKIPLPNSTLIEHPVYIHDVFIFKIVQMKLLEFKHNTYTEVLAFSFWQNPHSREIIKFELLTHGWSFIPSSLMRKQFSPQLTDWWLSVFFFHYCILLFFFSFFTRRLRLGDIPTNKIQIFVFGNRDSHIWNSDFQNP